MVFFSVSAFYLVFHICLWGGFMHFLKQGWRFTHSFTSFYNFGHGVLVTLVKIQNSQKLYTFTVTCKGAQRFDKLCKVYIDWFASSQDLSKTYSTEKVQVITHDGKRKLKKTKHRDDPCCDRVPLFFVFPVSSFLDLSQSFIELLLVLLISPCLPFDICPNGRKKQ